MFVQPYTTGRPGPADDPGLTGPAVDGAFLGRLRQLANMDGAALVGANMRWLEADCASPPAGLLPDHFSAIGLVVATPDPAARFILTVPIPVIDTARPHWLLLWDRRERPADASYRLLAQVSELVGHAAIARCRAAETRRQHLVERASATARIGIWSCTLPDETLSWTNGVYDLFELPRGAHVRRDQILKMYTPESAARMQALRAQAIATLGDFNFDAEIITTTGKHRWMRITATVDGHNGRASRIFGMKQDITEEKLLAERTRRLAETDTLTGLANRSRFQARLADMHGIASGQPVGSLLLVDLDRFKSVNDELGHALGDACLIEAGRRLGQCCPEGALVARIGGDEFAIILEKAAPIPPETLCARLVQAFTSPFALGDQSRHVGISIGIARNEGHDAETLFRNADTALYQAKSSGRGTWRDFSAA